ncbi:hypothetical protein Vafri_9312, partial [Volvox africanus]
LRSARRLQESLASLLPSVMAPHGGAGDPAAMDHLMRRITPLVQGGDDPLRQLELHEEVQIAVASLSVGPHRALRHPDLQYFWWRHMAGLEEVPWSTLWPHLITFLGNAPRLSDGAGDTGAALELLRSTEMVRKLQAAVHRMGYANYVNVAELDMAFGSGIVNGECRTLDEQLKFLLSPGRPVLLARTSKGARAEGWMKEAEAAAAARQGAVAAAAMADVEVAAVAAAQPAVGDAVTRQASAANVAVAGTEEEIWFDANSNFSRSNSSGFMSVLAGGDDASGFWPGRIANFSRPVSQVLLMAGNEDSPTRHVQYGSRVPSAALVSGQGLGLGPGSGFDSRSYLNFSFSRRPSLQQMRSKVTTGSGSGTGLAAVKEQEIRPGDSGERESPQPAVEAAAATAAAVVAASAVGASNVAAAVTNAATAAAAPVAGVAGGPAVMAVDAGAAVTDAGANGADGDSRDDKEIEPQQQIAPEPEQLLTERPPDEQQQQQPQQNEE